MLYFLACLYVALYYIRPFEWVPGIVGLPVLMVVGVFAVCVIGFGWISGQIKLFQLQTDWFTVGLMVAIVMSHVSNGNLWAVLPSVLAFLPAFVGYFLVAHGIQTEQQVDRFVFILIGLTLFLAFEGIRQYYTGVAHGGMEPIYSWETNEIGEPVKDLIRIRWYGVFNDPNDLGLALVVPIPFLINYLFQKKIVLAGVSLPILGFALYLTNSRGSVLAMFFGIFIFLVLHYRSIRAIWVGLPLALVGTFLGPSRMSDISAAGESASGRLDAWYEGFQMFKQNPFFGVGQGMFTEYHSLTAHNSYMQILAELGILGSIFFMGLFYFTFLWWKFYLSCEELNSSMNASNRSTFSAVSGSLAGVMAAMFFLSRSYILLPFMLTAVLVVCVRQVALKRTELFCDREAVKIRYYHLAIVVLGEIVFMNIVVKLFI